jgi:hypothetical protein
MRRGWVALPWAIGVGLPWTAAGPAGAAPPAGVADARGALAVLNDFALGLAAEPLLLGLLIAAVLLLFLGGVSLGQRQAWLRPPTAQPSPALTRAVAALQPASAPERALDVRRARQAVVGGQPLLLSLNYEIRPERRADYLAYMERLRDHLVRELGYAYAVWEQDGRRNWFTEMILCTTPQEFDRLAGPDDSATRRLLSGLDQFLRDPGRVQRTTLMGMAPPAMAAHAAGEPVARQPEGVLQPDSRSVPIPRAAREAPPGALPAEAA